MRRTLFVAALLLLFTTTSLSQAQYEISKDPKHPEVKVLRGIINKYLVQNDSSFNWYNSNQKIYGPDTAVLNALERTKGKIQFVVFGGTWCEDTQFVLPRFFKLQEMSGVKDDMITFFGVNREKRALGNIAEAFGITNVPTIIAMKDGRELGRIVEYGKTGKWDKELAELLK